MDSVYNPHSIYFDSNQFIVESAKESRDWEKDAPKHKKMTIRSIYINRIEEERDG